MNLRRDAELASRYLIKAPLGRGGLATVYRAEDLLTKHEVALKVVDLVDQASIEAFRREFSTLTRLFHPRLVRVHDFGRTQFEKEAVYFYASTFIRGSTLDRFAQGKTGEEVLPGFVDGLLALRYLHRAGLRHGDFKPQNLLIDGKGRGTLIDLGCAGAPRRGTISGTFGYLAPELFEDLRPDHRADLFAVGRTMEQLAELGISFCIDDGLSKRLTAENPGDRPSDIDEVLAALGVDPSDEIEAPLESPLVGRERELVKVVDLCERLRAGKPGPRTLWFHGPHGVGRSRLLREAKWKAQLRLRVVEGDARDPRALSELLSRALGGGVVPSGRILVLEARQRLRDLGAPVLLILDDAHLLGEEQQEQLAALVRILDETDPIALLCTSLELDKWEQPSVEAHEIAGLSETAVRHWIGDRLPSRRLPELMRVTGGFPGELHQLLNLIRSGAEELQPLAGAADLDGRRPLELARLAPDERALLGQFVACDGVLGPEFLEEKTDLSPDPTILGRLASKGWIVPEGSGFRLARLGDVGRLERLLDREMLSEIHRRIAARPGLTSTHAKIYHLVQGGLIDEAILLLEENWELVKKEAKTARRAIDVLVENRKTPKLLLYAAEIHELAGDPRRGLTIIDEARTKEGTRAQESDLELRAGSCHLKLGDSASALVHLSRAREAAASRESCAHIAHLECHAMNQTGDYREAIELAERALEWSTEERITARLLEDLGVAESYLGRTEDARRHLVEAEGLVSNFAEPRDRVRVLSYRAILEFRVGKLRAAGELYRRALSIAEEEGLADQIASCALNLGTISHRRAEWGDALASYARGLTIARVVGRLRAEVALRFNLAQIHCDVGLRERARQHLDQARRLAESGKLTFFVAACEMLAGEIALWSADRTGAEHSLSRAKELLAEHGTEREVADSMIHLVELALLEGEWGKASVRIRDVEELVERIGADDLRCRISMLAGRLALAEHETARALTLLEEARRGAERGDEQDLLAEIESWLAVACEEQGASHAARRHGQCALELWDRAAASLDSHLRDAFWAHPRRAHLPRVEAPRAEPVGIGTSSREKKLERLLEINSRLNSSLRTKEVLEYTMDAAVELTGAERGFLILAPDPDKGRGRLKVAVARNLDRERIGRSSMKYSRSIAEGVMRTGEPLLSAEALSDERLDSARSVQAMKLKSVLSVPIRAREGTLGALYVDNRFERGLFVQEDLDVLLGFADQVGIALTNARLLDRLEARTRELEVERRKISRSLEERSREVDRLTERVRLTEEALSGRRFRGILGRSRAMQSLFAVLEKVTDSTLTVLIQGESGTGKELVARAIHDEGPRKDSPFVTVNCAALPETLLESVLFGHKKGAFTGADQDRDGLFVHAGEGTLFLDEIGEIPLQMQAKLLRAIQEREVQPLGSTESLSVAARIICATNRRLSEEVEARRFREDLYYRLAVVVLEVPPLRERLEDLPELSQHILVRLSRELDRPLASLTQGALRRLLSFDFPGNVRQLENLLSQARIFCSEDTIREEDIQLPARAKRTKKKNYKGFQAREAAEIAAALQATRWNVTEVSRMLGIPRTSLYRKLDQYGLTRRRPPEK